jgi:hypothetical protein
MSALGQKQTYALQQAMSALLPIATAKADLRKKACLLYPKSGRVRCTGRCQLWAKSGHCPYVLSYRLARRRAKAASVEQ